MNFKSNISFISDSNFEKLLDAVNVDGKVYIPQAVTNHEGDTYYPYKLRTADTKFAFYGFRPSQPLKSFMFERRIKVADYPASVDSEQIASTEKITVVGAAACDVESLKSLDAVFLQDEFTDIFYRNRRNNTFIISADCTEPRATCLCTLAGIAPWPKEGFDLNLSMANNGYIIEAGSEKGEKVMADNSSLFSDTDDDMLGARDEQRSGTKSKVEEINKDYTLSRSRRDLLETQRQSDDWIKHVSTCIECAACLFACPTCHCFLLYDQMSASGKFERIKEWDACVYAGFSKMAGGGSPRLGLKERFRHRYLHKFEYFPKNFDFEACTGCGRCIEGCMGKIDMRKVLKALDTALVGAK